MRTIDHIDPSADNIWFYWDGPCEGSRAVQMRDALLSTRFFNQTRPIYMVSNTLEQPPEWTAREIEVVQWTDSIYDLIRDGDRWRPIYRNADPRDRSDLFRLLFLEHWGGSYVDSDDLALRALPPVSFGNVVCRSYDPHTCHYDGLRAEDCLPGPLRRQPAFDHIPIYPRNDVWLNFEPSSEFVRALVDRPELDPDKGLNTIHSFHESGQVSWQTLTLRTCLEHLPSYPDLFNLELTLVYLYESHVADCSSWDRGDHGGEFHSIWPAGEGEWGRQQYTRSAALHHFDRTLATFPFATHLWLHDKRERVSPQWAPGWFGDIALMSTHWLQYIRQLYA